MLHHTTPLFMIFYITHHGLSCVTPYLPFFIFYKLNICVSQRVSFCVYGWDRLQPISLSLLIISPDSIKFPGFSQLCSCICLRTTFITPQRALMHDACDENAFNVYEYTVYLFCFCWNLIKQKGTFESTDESQESDVTVTSS